MQLAAYFRKFFSTVSPSFFGVARVILIPFTMMGAATALPPNDDFASRTLIPSIPATVTGTTTSSTTEVGDPISPRSVWWKFTPKDSGHYSISAYPDSTPYFALHVYEGDSLATLKRQSGEMLSGAPSYTWLERFELVGGVEYSILVGSTRSWDHGPVTLKVTGNSSPTVTVTNPTSSTPYYLGEKLELRVNAQDADGSVVRVDYYHDLYYIEGQSQPVATSTEAPFAAWITLPSAGNYYENVYAVATDNQGAKTVSPSVRFLITYPTPNDFFADRKDVTGESVFEIGNNQYATTEPGEQAGQKSIWWSWTAPESKTYILSSRGWPGGFFPRIDVYTGSSVGALSPIGTGDAVGFTYTAQFSLAAIAGETYAIRVTTILGQGGETTFSILPPTLPGTPPQIEKVRLAEDGRVEVYTRSNGVFVKSFQGSPDMKTWASLSVAHPPNGIFKDIFAQPSTPSYFFRASWEN